MSPSDSFFETPRLRVRAFREADLEAFVAYRADPDVERYQSWSDYTLERGRALIDSMEGLEPGAPGQWYQFALENHADATLVGDLALKVDEDEPREAEVGFSLGARGTSSRTSSSRAPGAASSCSRCSPGSGAHEGETARPDRAAPGRHADGEVGAGIRLAICFWTKRIAVRGASLIARLITQESAPT